MTTEAGPANRAAEAAAVPAGPAVPAQPSTVPARAARPSRWVTRLFAAPADRTEDPLLPTAMTPPRAALSRFGWLYGSVWLFYLIEPAQHVLSHHSGAMKVYGLFSVAAFAAWYVVLFSTIRATRWQRWEVTVRGAWLAIAVLIALGVLMVPAAGAWALTGLVYVVAAAVMILPSRHAAILGGTLVAIALFLDYFGPGDWNTGSGLVFGMVVSGLAVWGVRQMIARNAELMAAHQQIARLAVAEERARTARDLHDILGHSLTVITVKAELAGRLIQVDPARAEREVNDVEQLSREALADVRRTVSGYRSVTLANELASARSALDAAGIEAALPSAVDEVPGGRRELFGWVVREGVTNVVRHSGARNCVITVSPAMVEIADDGTGPTEQPAEGRNGTGLQGLRERVECAGGALTVGRSSLGGFLLRVSLR